MAKQQTSKPPCKPCNADQQTRERYAEVCAARALGVEPQKLTAAQRDQARKAAGDAKQGRAIRAAVEKAFIPAPAPGSEPPDVSGGNDK